MPGGGGDLDVLLANNARRFGERVYLETIDPPGRLTFLELDDITNRVAQLLADRGVRTNARISLISDNCLAFVILFFGIQRYGAIVNPINVEVNARNLEQILDDVEPRLVLWNRSLPGAVRDIVECARCETIAFTDRGPHDADDELFSTLARAPSGGGCRVATAQGSGIIDYTSGTTARPKGVCFSREAYFETCRAMAERLGLAPEDRMLECRALSWASPQTLTLGPTLHAGATLVLARKFSRSHFFEWLRRYRITIAATVPAVINMLCERPEPVTGDDLPALRFITSSSAPLAPARQLEFERRYRIPIVQGAGMTEAAGFIAINPPMAPRAGSIGPAMPYLRARFVDERGAVCEPGREGELIVGGPCMASAYLTERGVLVPIAQADFPTGDLGYMDGDGYIYVTGRRKDLIIRGGVNIAPLEITTALLAHEAVADAATIGVPDPVYGEAIVSFVAPREGCAPGEAELRAHCRTRLSEFKLPARIHVVDAIPRTHHGKVARELLLALTADTGGRQ